MPWLQGSLFGAGELELSKSAPRERIRLDDSSWVDLTRGWLGGADTLFECLATSVDWRHGRRWMYDRMVDDPRLSRWYGPDEQLPHPVLARAREALGQRYQVPFGAVGLNYYRDDHDSVAYHRDRELRHLDDTLVAIITLGAARPFKLRPLEGGKSVQLQPGSGDLLVMGGACQARWEHSVPKSRSGGPRISATYRWSSGVGPETARRERRRDA